MGKGDYCTESQFLDSRVSYTKNKLIGSQSSHLQNGMGLDSKKYLYPHPNNQDQLNQTLWSKAQLFTFSKASKMVLIWSQGFEPLIYETILAILQTLLQVHEDCRASSRMQIS